MRCTLPLLTIALVLLPGSSRGARPRVDEVIERAVRAMGGLQNIHSIHSLVFRGFHYEGSYQQEFQGSRKSNATLIRMRPNSRLVGCRPEIPACEGQWSRIAEAFDGHHGWELNWPKQRLVNTTNKAEQALRCGAEFDFLFIDYRERGFRAAYLGLKTLFGARFEAVQVNQTGCSSAIYYFAPRSYELRMTELLIPLHARGDFVRTAAIYKDFKTVNGVRLPSRSEEVNLATGEVIGGGAWTSIDANTLDDPKIFQAPDVHPTGITAAVLQMLKVSATAGSEQMMAIYAAFRATEAGAQADVAYDMNWLGFELLKADRYDHALAVLRQVIAEDPDSANAYDSLGEAYLQKHDSVGAIGAFQHALDLGLNSDDVRRKLAALRREPPGGKLPPGTPPVVKQSSP